MEYRRFEVPSDAEMLDVLGVSPELVEGESTVYAVRLASVGGDDVLISYDIPGRSFRIQVSSDNVMRLDLLRESATRLSVDTEGDLLRVRLMVQSSDLAGELDVLVGPDIVVQDRLLMV